MVLSLTTYMLEVDAYLRSTLSADETPDKALEEVLVAGEQFREETKEWLQ